MTEAALESIRDRLKLSGIAFEHFWLTQRKEYLLRMKPCPMCELLADYHLLFISTSDDWRRNSRYVSGIQAKIAVNC